MVSLQEPLAKCGVEPISSPRISFSSEFLDEKDFISICPGGEREKSVPAGRNLDFEFLSGGLTTSIMMSSADELFSEGKLLPSWHVEKLATLKTAPEAGPKEAEAATNHDQDRRISWFLDDDPSPRPPTCTVLWKELLRLKKQRPSTLSPSSSSSSSSSSENSSRDERKKGEGEKSKVVNRVKKGLERTRSAASSSIRIRPMINVPICTARNASLPPLFPLRRSSSRLES